MRGEKRELPVLVITAESPTDYHYEIDTGKRISTGKISGDRYLIRKTLFSILSSFLEETKEE